MFYEARMFTAVFKTAVRWTVSWGRLSLFHTLITYLICFLILFSHLPGRIVMNLSSSHFPTKTPYSWAEEKQGKKGSRTTLAVKPNA